MKASFLFFFLFFISCDSTKSFHQQISSAQEAIYEGEYKKAAKLYKKIAEQTPRQPLRLKSFYQLGQLYELYLEDRNQALSYYQKIIKETDDPDWVSQALEKKGEIYFHFLKDFKRAAFIYQDLLERYSFKKKDFYEYKYAFCLLKAGDYKKLQKSLEAIRIKKSHDFYKDAFFIEGEMFFYQKKWDQAVSSWKQFLDLNPPKVQETQTKFLIANAYETQEKLQEAYDLYYSILKDYPHPEIIKERLESIYARKVARRR